MPVRKLALLTCLLIPLSLAACAAPAAPTEEPTEELEPPATSAPTDVPPTATPEPAVTLYYHANAQVELISPEGVRVLIDVYSPRALSSPATADDILLTTHGHADHINGGFMEAFEGEQIDRREGEITVGDVTVHGIPASHDAVSPFLAENGSNYLFLVEMGGLRIAHFGDIGQEALTPEQLEILGAVDILITQFANPYADMSAENLKGFNLVEQLDPQPRVILTTHIDAEAAALTWERWTPVFIEEGNMATFSRSTLPEETNVYFIGMMARTYRMLSEKEGE